MKKYIYSVILAISLFACSGNSNNDNLQSDDDADSIMVDSISTVGTELMPSDSLKYCIMDTLPSGEIFYVKMEANDTASGPYGDTTILKLFRYGQVEGNLVDSIAIEDFCKSALNDNPGIWWDTCYILCDTAKAYAHLTSASNSSFENQTTEKHIDLIAITPHTIRKVLSSELSSYSCKRHLSDSEDCQGETLSFQTTETMTNGYYDLIVTKKNWREQLNIDNGEMLDSSSTTKRFLVKYQNGKYDLETEK